MKEAQPYLIFNGNCGEAMAFYGKAMGAQVEIQNYDAAPIPEEFKIPGRVIHARLQKGPTVIMASDSRVDQPATMGNNLFVSLQCESREEVDRLFKALGAAGEVLMPLGDTFWNAYFGMIRDKFGVGWMFNHEKPKAGPTSLEGGG